MLEQMQTAIRQQLADALAKAIDAGDLTLADGAEAPAPGAIELERPRDRSHGDLATNIAMVLARPARKAPRQIAESLLKHVDWTGTYVAEAEIAGPGFLNMRFDPAWRGAMIEHIRQQGEDYGRSQAGQGKRVNVEFVSANPTGPMLVVQGRTGAMGDTLCNIMEFAGYKVEREFYVNDGGQQILTLGLSMEVRIRQQLGEDIELPDDCYPGEYVIDYAKQYLAEHGEAATRETLQLPETERHDHLGLWTAKRIRQSQEDALLAYGVRFDRWFSERALREAGEPERVIELLTERGHTYEHDGALWLRSTTFGDDKDRVLRKSDGTYTYVVPDIAYHLNKFGRPNDIVIDILGPDHHGYIGRMRAALQALGVDPASFEVLIAQHVSLVRDGKVISSSKRSGNLELLEDLLKETGKDAARFFFLMRAHETPLEFDLDLARTQTQENPVFYVQYAHARISSLLRQPEAAALLAGEAGADGSDYSLLTDESEAALVAHLAAFPEEIAGAALARSPHHLARYATETATAFHSFYTRCRVLGEAPPLSRARLALCEATGIVLRNCLRLAGVEAPEKM